MLFARVLFYLSMLFHKIKTFFYYITWWWYQRSYYFSNDSFKSYPTNIHFISLNEKKKQVGLKFTNWNKCTDIIQYLFFIYLRRFKKSSHFQWKPLTAIMCVLTIPTEVRAVTVLMMVGITLNFPACAEMTNIIKLAIITANRKNKQKNSNI